VVFLNSTETESLIDGHTINIPHKRVESEVSTARDSFGLAGSQVCSVKVTLCIMPPPTDACEVINNCLVEYGKHLKILHKEDTAKLLEGNSHLNDDVESGKSEDMKTQKEAKLCLVANCDRAETNDTTQATISNSALSDSRDVTSE
jgi:hypothetical protein